MKSSLSALALLLLGIASPTWASDTTPPPFAIISPQVAAKLKPLASTPTAQSVIKSADSALTQAPDPLPRVHTEGTLPHQGIWDKSMKAKEDWKTMLNLGFAWQFTHDPRYLQAEEKYLNAWLDVYKISFNPIDETQLDTIIMAYDLTRADLSEATRTKMTPFLQTIAQGYLDAIERKKDPGNWQSHRIKLATLAAFALDDPSLIARAKAVFLLHLTQNIKADGSTYDFHLRDALHYAVYDLEPLSISAIAAKVHGQDWFHAVSAGQPSVAAGIDWLIPYATGQQTHEEFVHSPVKFDAERAAAGVKGYSGTWDPAHSVTLFELAVMLDPKYQPVMDQFTQKGIHPQDWSTLLVQAGI